MSEDVLRGSYEYAAVEFSHYVPQLARANDAVNFGVRKLESRGYRVALFA